MIPRLALILAALAVASPAWAVMPPIAYEQARAAAPDVMVIRMLGVGLPAGRYGACEVRGQVTAVERGTGYHVGQEVRIQIACAYSNADVPTGGTLWTDIPHLQAAHTARAFLEGGGAVMGGFNILS